MDTIFGYLQSGFSAVVPFVILLGLLIFVHELGHFLVAVWCGVRVETFSLGFGKKILQYRRGDTTYCLSLFPIGGYVKMFGDEIGAQLPENERQFSFTHKPVWKRIAIVLAGPVMNFLFAIFLFGIIASVGEEVRLPRIGDINEKSPAYQNGFRSGDLIVAVDQKPIKSWDQFQHIVNNNRSNQLQISIKHDGQENVHVISAPTTLKPNPNLLSMDDMVGEIDGVSPISRASVVGVKSKSLAEKFGLKTGDRIVKVNDRAITYFRELENTFLSLQGQNINVSIERLAANEKPESSQLSGSLSTFASLQSFGVESPDLYLAKVLDGTPAQKAGLQSGDRVVGINELVPRVWEDVLNKVKSYDEKTDLTFKVERNGQVLEFPLKPQMTSQVSNQYAEEKRFTVGIVPWVLAAPPDLGKNVYAGLVSPVIRGFERTVDITAMTLVSFLRLVQNKISPKNVSGVISIGVAAAETFKTGWTYFVQMMAVISVNLFVLNLLPIPVLDGGHLLFYCIEALRGAPLSMKKMEIAQQVGLVLLMSLMVFALFNDFSRVFGIW